jgi:alkyl hydroperoxide reductase subunit D
VKTLEELRAGLPESARDLKLNLQAVMSPAALSAPQRFGVAVASAASARNGELLAALIAEAEREVGRDVVEDGLAAAAVMGMNNVYYRFRHFVGKPSYAQKPARLRMQKLASPVTNKLDFELFCLAASAVNGCENCVRSHEAVVVEGGLSEDQVHDAIRLAATIHGVAVALDFAAVPGAKALASGTAA